MQPLKKFQMQFKTLITSQRNSEANKTVEQIDEQKNYYK